MTQPIESGSTPRPRRRRWPWILLGVLLVAGLVVVSIPWLLNTPAGNRLVAAQLARAFAPGHLRFRAIRLSWTGPTRLSEVVLEEPGGKPVVTSPSTTLSASLWGLIVRPERPGTLALRDAQFDVERRPDGSIDLVEALQGIFSSRDPLRELTIRADGASLRFRGPALAEPLSSVAMDLAVQLRPSPESDSWSVDLRRSPSSTLSVRGKVDRWNERHDLDIEAALAHWPLATQAESVELRLNLDGRATAHRIGGHWRSQGRMQADEIRLTGAALKGDSAILEALSADWSVSQAKSGGWSAERLEVTSPYGHLSAVVPERTGPDTAARIEGQLDVAALARQAPKSLGIEGLDRIESGTIRLKAATGRGDDWLDWSLDASLADLAWKDGPDRRRADPVSLAGRARFQPGEHRLDVREVSLSSPYGSVRATGQMNGLDGPARMELTGSIAPDWEALSKLLAEHVEPTAKLAGPSGKPSTFRVDGPLAWDAMKADLGLELGSVEAFGMRVSPVRVGAQARDGRIAFDPIETTLNGGRLHVEPDVDLKADGGPVVRLGDRSTLADADVNEDVTRRILSYVAPVLDQATRASGKVSVAIDQALIPIGGERRASVTGKVVFQDVQFAPGPLTREVVGLVAPRREPGILRLDQPVLLTIADGRVNQRGLAIPIGDVTRVEVEGWVGFDRSLGLVAALPVTPAMFGDNPLLGSIVAGTKIRVPIRGTLDAPKLDKAAFNADLKELGKALLVRGAGAGALELLDRLARPRDPNAPPPMTPAERKAQRLERRNERRKARGLDPLPPDGDRP